MHKNRCKAGPGRPKGSRQVRSSSNAIRAAKASGKALPLDYLLAVMNDNQQDLNERLKAAIAAAPYVHPRLQSVAMKNHELEPLQVNSAISDALKTIAELSRNRIA